MQSEDVPVPAPVKQFGCSNPALEAERFSQECSAPVLFTNRHKSHSPKQDLAKGKWCKGNLFYKISKQMFL